MADRTGITEITAPVAAGSENTPLAVHFANEDQGGLKFFATTAEMTTFAQSQMERCYKSVAYVKSGENSYPSLYAWTGTKPDGTDGQYTFIGYIGGVVAADVDGAVSRLNSTFVFDSDFAIEQAGDQGNGLLVKLSDAVKKAIEAKTGGAMTINGKSIKDLTVMSPLQVDNSQGKDRLLVTPGSYEPMTAPSFLGKSTSIKLIEPGSDTVIFANEPITPYGAYFSPDNALQGIKIQEDDNRDPNLGGQLTEVLASVSFSSKATMAGTIKMWLMYHQNGAYIPDGYLIGYDGKPVIYEKSFSVGDELKMVLPGAYYAQGQETIVLHVEHSFTNEDLSINPEETLLCVNQFENGNGTSLARIEFQRRVGVTIIPAIYKFESGFVSLSHLASGLSIPEEEVEAGKGREFISQFDVINLTNCIASIDRGMLTIKDNGVDILDFYVDYLVDSTRTSMMRGKQFTITAKIENDHSAFNLALFSWTGKRNEPAKIYSSRNNDSLVLNAGWTSAGEKFIAENADQNLKTYTFTVTVPNDAVNLAFAIYPGEAQNPNQLTIKDIQIDPKAPFTGYAEIERYNTNEVHLNTADDFAEYGQNCEGFASLRYTLGYKPIVGYPLPMGELVKGNAPFTLDKTRNVIAGSQARGGEGVLVAEKDGQVSISFEFLLWNEQGADSVVDFWLVLYQDGQKDGEETKIMDSGWQFTVPAKQTTHGVPKTAPAFVFEIEKGQAFGLRGSANKADGAFLESTRLTDYMVRPVIDFKELTS